MLVLSRIFSLFGRLVAVFEMEQKLEEEHRILKEERRQHMDQAKWWHEMRKIMMANEKNAKAETKNVTREKTKLIKEKTELKSRYGGLKADFAAIRERMNEMQKEHEATIAKAKKVSIREWKESSDYIQMKTHMAVEMVESGHKYTIRNLRCQHPDFSVDNIGMDYSDVEEGASPRDKEC